MKLILLVIKRSIINLFVFSFIPFRLIYLNNLSSRFFRNNNKFLNAFSRFYFQYRLIPKKPKKIILDEINNTIDFNVTIIIHGPVIRANAFTLVTIGLYRHFYPNIDIILSVWSDDKKYLNKKLLDEKVKIIYNEKPKFSGLLNLNYQIVKIKSALGLVETGRVLITRSDMRFNNIRTIKLLESYLGAYKSPKHELINERIITVNILSRKFIPFSISEMFQYGEKADLARYWDIDLLEKKITREDYFQKVKNIHDYSDFYNPEMTLMQNYLSKSKLDDTYSITNYYGQLRDYFIILDIDDIDLFWYKYSPDISYWTKNSSNSIYQLFDHSEWIMNYYNYEKYLHDGNLSYKVRVSE